MALKPIPGAGVKKQEPKKPTRVYLFIDDSNLFIEGQRTAASRTPSDMTARRRFRIDFGRLLEWVTEGRTLADVYLVGSDEADSRPRSWPPGRRAAS